MPAGPLNGIKILDLTRLLPGPLATQYLADLGADVIKIEDIKYPDYIRNFPPHVGGESVHFLSVNRSKKSLALDLNSDEGISVFLELVAKADVVMEGFRPGKIEELGLGFEVASRVNPGIIYVSISGYGQDSPLMKKAGHDLNYVGYAGLIALTGKNGKMAMPGLQIADIMGGSYNAVIGCLSALISRGATGKGQHVDVSMTDGVLPLLSIPLGEYLNTGTNYGPGEFMLAGGLANYHIYECQDGKYVALGSLEPKFWMGFCQMVGHPEWMGKAMPGSGQIEELKADIAELFRTKTRDEWIEYAAGFDICLSPVLHLNEIEDHPHFRSRKMITEHEHERYGKVKGIAQPLKFSGEDLHEGWAAPALGEHSKLVLKEFDFDEKQVQDLAEKGIIK
jgi:crotonobetainyl-CoA:carnitine CoA-transferase CaiB-like acyl-CoA transferase